MTFGIVGGDRRYSELARLLERDGHTVLTCRISGEGIETAVSQGRNALEQALSAETVVLPLPLCREPGYLNCAGKPLAMRDVLDLLARSGEQAGEQERSGEREQRSADGQKPPTKQDTRRRLVLAGMVPVDIQQEAAQRGIRLVDYFRLESLVTANAAATADAAACLTVQHSRETLTGKRCLVLGFGRIGKLLCLRLRGLGASVAAAARKRTDRAWIRAIGCDALHALSGHLDGFDVVYNTVPAPVLDRALLEELAGGGGRSEEANPAVQPAGRGTPPLLVELASQPGFDRDAAERLGLRVLHAPGLPGKLVPVTAAAALRDAVYELLTEESAARSEKAVYESGI